MNQNTWQQIGPVAISILVILAVAVLRSYTRTQAAIAATMPIAIPLSIWIIHSGGGNDQASMVSYTSSLVLGIVGTVIFCVVVALAARAGWQLVPMMAAGYAAWAVWLVVFLALQRIR